MKNDQDINDWIDETIESAGHIKKMESNPFLYEKVMHRIRQQGTDMPTSPVWIPALRLAAVVLLVVLNGWFIGNFGGVGNAIPYSISDYDVTSIIDSYGLETESESLYN